METVAVLDVGKTNVKLVATSADGRPLEIWSRPNPVFPGPPYAHHDLALIESWLVANLKTLAASYSISAIVATGHGSGGVLVDGNGPVMPMLDYEQEPPEDIAREYPLAAGSFRDRGSACMMASAHLAKQMLWLETGWPRPFAEATAYLAHPQYWAWRLSGVMASEVTSLAAQSHLWCAPDARFTTIVKARGWERLIPPLAPAWKTLGTLKQGLAEVTGLGADVRILAGIHDSSANFYRYQAAGLQDMTTVSTGTWIAPISDKRNVDFDTERPGFCCNSDVSGNPLPGMLVMGGREFGAIAGEATGPASEDVLDRLVATETMALPSFSADDGLFPGTSKRGIVAGPLSQDAGSKFTLAVLYAALLTDRCLDTLDSPTILLDGSFVQDPLYGAVVAALRPDRRVMVNAEHFGTVAGAALLATHETRMRPAALDLARSEPLGNPNLIDYARKWREQAERRKPRDRRL